MKLALLKAVAFGVGVAICAHPALASDATDAAHWRAEHAVDYADYLAVRAMENRICQSVHLGNAVPNAFDPNEAYNTRIDVYYPFTEGDNSMANGVQAGYQVKCQHGIARQEWRATK